MNFFILYPKWGLRLVLAFTAMLTLSMSCSTGNKLMKTSLLPSDWTMVPIPNSLDKVGDIFSIKKGRITHIFTLNVNTVSGKGELPKDNRDRQVSWGAMLSFLNIPVLDSFSLGGGDTAHLQTHFEVSNPQYIRADNHLPDSFKANKIQIIDDLNFYDQNSPGRSQTYIIAEILKSSSVNINLYKTSKFNVNIKAIIAKLVKANPIGLTVQNKDSTTLAYNLKDSLVVFYKLVNISKQFNGKGKNPDIPTELVSDAELDLTTLNPTELRNRP